MSIRDGANHTNKVSTAITRSSWENGSYGRESAIKSSLRPSSGLSKVAPLTTSTALPRIAGRLVQRVLGFSALTRLTSVSPPPSPFPPPQNPRERLELSDYPYCNCEQRQTCTAVALGRRHNVWDHALSAFLVRVTDYLSARLPA
jgi:hypothetical protein